MAQATGHQDRYLSIHYLRATAALMVVQYHIFSHHLVTVADPDHVIWLKQGVGIFFVISGFVMVASTAHEPLRAGQFLLRRLWRVGPLYWLTTVVMALFAGISDWPHLVSSLLFIPIFDAATGLHRMPVLHVGWTLNFEMAFYAMFALATLLPRRIGIWTLSLFLAALALAPSIAATSPFANHYLRPYWLDFAAGVLIAQLGLRAPGWLLPLGFILLAVAPSFTSSWFLFSTLPAALIVASARAFDGKIPEWRPAMLLGDASYAIYLTHLFVLLPLLALLGSNGHPALIVSLGFAGTIAVGIVIHLGVEKPLLGLYRHRPISEPAAEGISANPRPAWLFRRTEPRG